MNGFYQEFDTETLGKRHSDPYRSVFQVDRNRVLYSAAFRRLQNKTQVFKSGAHDFYRTRLTHSLEVAQIGRSIVNYINKTQFGSAAVDSDLVEAICLAHDLGNPPYGHSGEALLNDVMKAAGGFEGNAQTLKIITEQLHEDIEGDSGMKPSRAFLDGILKYKILWSDSGKKGKFLYDDQRKYLDFVNGGSRHFEGRSLECQIMNWADDVAYSLHDLSDGYLAGFISRRDVENWAKDQTLTANEKVILEQVMEKLGHREDFDRFLAGRTGKFIEGLQIREREHPLASRSNRYRYGIAISEAVQDENTLYKRLAVDIIFRSPQLEQLEFKGRFILKRLFETYMQGGPGDFRLNRAILPTGLREKLKHTSNPDYAAAARLICDYFAEQTDISLPRIYKRLFDPDYGSFYDIV
ncbi:MAG: dNTP triphosphohydrolase [Candidatus Marinimicrobia bacterium]|jgi:dGTPase|nr:dNTP triphosphohydrolase [Candidatus Neomarinimicrobiota bacterium]MDD5709883.1 dNTP triphosphohydrolase [Candidatus Neomarinimicrobiota bacterium]MDX9777205.1 dNTP triphosphohydrolase [bacterium]